MKAIRPFVLRGRRETLRHHTLLVPMSWRRERPFQDTIADPCGYDELIKSIQRFRGASYLADGALRGNQLSADGRHCQSVDFDSWHLVKQDELGAVISCARYHALPDPRFDHTSTSKSALASSPEWRPKVKAVVDDAIRRAVNRGAVFAELGGWCLANAARNTSHALRTVLHMYALGEILGGTIGLSTATKRHSSSSILQRLGAQKAHFRGEVLPSYFDPAHDCEMELLQFDSLRPAPRYARQIAEYAEQMRTELRVVCHDLTPPASSRSLLPREIALRSPTPVEMHGLRTYNM